MTVDPISADPSAEARRVLPQASWDYFAGGAGHERTLRENEAAWGRYRLRPRVLVDVSAVDMRTTVVGQEVAFPVLVAPCAIQRLAHPDGEVAVARAAEAVGTVFGMSTTASATLEEVSGAAPAGIRWFQLDLHRDREHSFEAIERAVELGFTAVMLTVDSPVPGIRYRDQRNNFTVPDSITVPGIRRAPSASGDMSANEFYAINDPATTWHDLCRLVDTCPVPVIVKGIQRGDDARRAVDAGAAAVIVSNHGGRQLDGVAATCDVLPEVVTAVGGAIDVLVDGGIRTATDVAVALSLGATATLVGRPVLWGLAVAGQTGAQAVLETFRDEFAVTLALLGCPRAQALSRDFVTAEVAFTR